MPKVLEYKGSDEYGHTKLTLTIENDKITKWDFIATDFADEEVDSDFELAEILEAFPKCQDDEIFETIDLFRYGHSATFAGVIYKPTKQIIGYQGYYDSYNGTEYEGKFIADLVYVTVPRMKDIKDA